MWRIACLAVIVALVVFASITLFQGQPTEAASAKVDPRVVAANTEFGFKLFKQFVRASGGKNVVMSPASVSLALSMTYNGANGTTRNAMAKALAYSNVSLDEINAGNKALMQNLMQPGPGVEVSIANSLWGSRGVQFKPEFMKRNREFYQAEVAALNFSSPTAKDTINSWVSDKTHGKISSIIDHIDPSSILYLVNAVYFNGKWSAPFDKALTKNHDFTLADGKVIKVPMMFHSGGYEYTQFDGFQLIKLDYGAKRRIGMYVLLPGKGSNLGELYKQLSRANWDQWIKRAKGTGDDVDLWLPKFKADYSVQAKSALLAMGMGVAFDPVRADFTAMCPIPPSPNVWIGEVVHKAVVEVDEQGTVAAASTSVNMPMAAPGPMSQVRMVVDHPFFFAIRDDMTGEILFIGSITDPR